MAGSKIAGNTLIVFGANIFSMLFGYGASALVAATFGSGAEVDAFFVALPLPMISGYFVLSVSLMSLTPVYQRIRLEDGLRSAQTAIAPFFWAVAGLSLALSTLVWFFSESLARGLAPGFDAQRTALLTQYLQISALALPFIISSAFLQSIENANNLFLRAAFARPIASGMALGALVLLASDGSLVNYFWGLTIGAALAFFWQLQESFSFGTMPFGFSGFGLIWRRVKSSVGWITLARGMGHASELALLMIASLAIAGTVAIYGFGFKIAAIPLLLSISLSLVLFPSQSQAYADRKEKEAESLLWKGVNSLAILGALFGSFFFLFADQLVILLYERGDFNPALTESVSDVIRIFSVGLVAIAANNTIANAFWAAGRMKERVSIEALSIGILLIGAFLLIESYGAVGLGIAYLAQFVFLFGVGLWRLSATLGELIRNLSPLFRISLAALALVIGFSPVVLSVENFREFSLISQLGYLGVSVGVFAAVFFALLWLLRVPQAREVIARLKDIAARGKQDAKLSSASSVKTTQVNSAELR